MKGVAIFLTVTIFLWLLPLGVFIKPSQERTACDGTRAFHMCSMMMKSSTVKSTDKVSITANSDFGNGAKSQGSVSNDLLLPSFSKDSSNQDLRFYAQDFIFSASTSLNSIFHPPKVTFIK